MNSREAFEKWLDENHLFDTSEFIQDEDERIKAKESNLVYKAWQASRKQLLKELSDTAAKNGNSVLAWQISEFESIRPTEEE